jgi:hypothetical protein
MGEAKRRKLLLGERYGVGETSNADQKPYLRANPMSPVLHEVWRSTCSKGFALYGRGVLYRSVAVGLGQSVYVPLTKIDDPVGRQIVGAYNPAKEFVVAEPNEKTGTRWQVFQK